MHDDPCCGPAGSSPASDASHLSIPGKFRRREFLRRSALLTGAGIAAPWALDLAGLTSASTADANDDYKALVCVFLFGGNDNADTIVPYDRTSYNAYRSLRESIARERADLLPLAPINGFEDGRSLAFVEELSGLKQLFDDENLAVMSNLGTLIGPITKAEFADVSKRPPQIGSHNDQQSLWQSSEPEGASSGWGGRISDLMLDDNGGESVFTCVSVAGNAVMMTGREAFQYQVTSGGVTQLDPSFESSSVLTGLQEVLQLEGGGVFPASYSPISDRALATSARLDGAIDAAGPITTPFPDSGLAEQLRMVSKLIAAGRGTLGLKRQVFFVSAGGFDNHGGIVDTHRWLIRDVSEALAAFHAATVEIGAQDDVTTFTASDFGRTLTTNGSGSDHGWGSHHVVMGGAVRGKRVYGRVPVVADDGPDDIGAGRLIPTTSVDQYAATLASWMGVTGSELDAVAPNIGRFDDADLGFMIASDTSGDPGSDPDSPPIDGIDTPADGALEPAVRIAQS